MVATTLQPEEEFRFEVGAGLTMSVTLVQGTAEIFGAEMAEARAYSFSGTQQAVFTWHGCTLEVDGQCGHSYVASETPMVSYLALHAQLESRREAAAASGADGPRVLVAGPPGAGKSSLCRLLANYAARGGHGATLVELDVGRCDISIPGCIAAMPVSRPLDIERSTTELSPLAYWLGHTSSADHAVVYTRLVEALAGTVHARLSARDDARAYGVVAAACSSVANDVLLQQIKALNVDTIIVLDADRLHSQLAAHAQASKTPLTVIKASRSGGVTMRGAAERAAACNGRLTEYFHGLRSELFPHPITLALSEIEARNAAAMHSRDAPVTSSPKQLARAWQVYTIALAPQAPASALPMRAAAPTEQLLASRMAEAQYPSLTHTILALCALSARPRAGRKLCHVRLVPASAQGIRAVGRVRRPDRCQRRRARCGDQRRCGRCEDIVPLAITAAAAWRRSVSHRVDKVGE